MNVNITFKANSFANGMLRTMGDYVTGQADGDSRDHLAKLVADGRVRLVDGGVEQTGKNGWAGRSAADKKQNNEMRTAFVTALANELGLKETSGELLERLESLFGRDVFKTDDYGKGRPLTMRRITAVLNKVDEAKQLLLTEQASMAFDRLSEDGPELKDLMEAALAKQDLGIDRDVAKAIGAQFSQFVDRACLGAATTFDLEGICSSALSSLKEPAGAKETDAEALKALTEKLQSALGGPDGPFWNLVGQVKRDAELCLSCRAQFHGGYFAQRYPRADVEPLLNRFSAVLGNDEQKCRMYALIRLQIDDEINKKEIAAKDVMSYTCGRLREFGVTDDEARQLWGIDDLKMRTAEKAEASALTAVKVQQLIDDELVPGLGLLLGMPNTGADLGRLAGKLKAECPTFGEPLSAYGEKIKASVSGLADLGKTLLMRVGAERPDLTMQQKLAAVGRMLQTVKAEVSAQMTKGEFDLEQAIRGAAVPPAEELAQPTVREQMSAFKALLLQYRAEFTDEMGNANNADGFRSRTRSKLEAILGTLDKIVAMSAAKDQVLAKLEEAKALVKGNYKKPCNATAPGREAVAMIQEAMNGAGAHGDTNAAGEMAFAVQVFCEVPELLCMALEADAKNGNDKCLRELCEALNTDGCVQAYAETVAVVHDRFNSFEADINLGKKGEKVKLEVLIGRAFQHAFPGVTPDNPISFDDFAERFAHYLADRDRGSYQKRLAEIRGRKDELMGFLVDIGVVDRPVLSKTTIFNMVFSDPERQTGKVVRDGEDFVWQGVVFRAETRSIQEVRENGQRAAQPVDGFSSRKDLSVPENLQEAKGIGESLGATGQSGVSCCRTVKQCIGYATVREVGQDSYVYVIDTTKMGPDEKAWDMDSVYDARGGRNARKTGTEVNASSIRNEAVLGWIKVPTRIAGIDRGTNGMSIEETKFMQLKIYAEQHPDEIKLNTDSDGPN